MEVYLDTRNTENKAPPIVITRSVHEYSNGDVQTNMDSKSKLQVQFQRRVKLMQETVEKREAKRQRIEAKQPLPCVFFAH